MSESGKHNSTFNCPLISETQRSQRRRDPLQGPVSDYPSAVRTPQTAGVVVASCRSVPYVPGCWLPGANQRSTHWLRRQPIALLPPLLRHWLGASLRKQRRGKQLMNSPTLTAMPANSSLATPSIRFTHKLVSEATPLYAKTPIG